MSRLSHISEDLTRTLLLRYRPAGVMLYDDPGQLDPGIEFSGRELKSYCQALVLAGKGETLMMKKEQMGCKLGTSVLGFENETDMARYLDDGVLEKYGVGLFGTEAASAETILNSTYLDKGATQACLVAPLDRFDQDPQVVVFTADSEQVMWLLYALNYDTGGKMELPQSGGALGGCADITALPIKTGQPDITFLGLGCRLKSGIGPGDLMLGIAGKDLESVHSHILDMKKPIAMLHKQRT
jgi:uncharacterized protein (DUF169 family)